MKDHFRRTGKPASLIHTVRIVSSCYSIHLINFCSRQSGTGQSETWSNHPVTEDFLTGVLIDDAGGMYPTDEVYSDLDIDKLETLAPTQPHRDVDLALVNADTEGLL